jgi:RNA polymerase sigma-70 factor, ECF subfamily
MDVVKGPDSIRDRAVCQLVHQYQTALLRMCYLYLQDEALAEDAVQETFVKAYRAMPDFRNECSEKTWLMRIAINTCRDMKRSGWFRYVDRHITPEELPEASVPFAQADEELTLAIIKLPRKCKEVFMLRYYQGMSVTEIAASLNVTPSTVSNQLNRARRKLRTMLERGRFHE